MSNKENPIIYNLTGRSISIRLKDNLLIEFPATTGKPVNKSEYAKLKRSDFFKFFIDRNQLSHTAKGKSVADSKTTEKTVPSRLRPGNKQTPNGRVPITHTVNGQEAANASANSDPEIPDVPEDPGSDENKDEGK